MSIKIGATILIITAGMVGGYLIVKNSSPAAITDKSQNNSIENEKLIPGGNPIKWVEKAVGGLSDIFEKSPKENKAAPEMNDSENLTDLVGKIVAGQIKTLDQNAGGEFNLNDSKNQELIDKALAGLNGNSFFDVQVDDKDLKISSDNSKEMKIKYLRGIERISAERFNSSEYQKTVENIIENISKSCSGGDNSSLLNLAQLYKNLTNDYLNLQVPSDWLSFHKDVINHFQKAHLVYAALANCLKDPIKTQIATQVVAQLVEQAWEIQNMLAKKYQEAGL